MKNPFQLVLLAATLALALTGCEKKAQVKSSVTELEQSLSAPAAPPPAQAQPSAANPVPQNDAQDLVKSAVAAAQANDYASSVIALQAAQQKPGLSADQILAAQRTRQTLIADLQRRAVNGDQAALAQLKAIERSRSQ